MFTEDIQEETVFELVSLQDKVAVVTGAAQGIGFAIAQRLAQAGARVVIADLSEERAKQSATQIQQKFGIETQGISADVSDTNAIKSLIEQTIQSFGRLDIWINNAGIYNFIEALSINDADWDKLMSLNLRGSFIACREAAKHMVNASDGGVIINVLSTAALKTSGNAAHYVASKHGLAGLTKAFAVELGEKRVRVLAVAPTLVDTPGVEKLKQSDSKVKQQLDDFEKDLPLRRMAVPDDIAKVILFCASKLAAFLTGVVIPVDGGETAI